MVVRPYRGLATQLTDLLREELLTAEAKRRTLSDAGQRALVEAQVADLRWSAATYGGPERAAAAARGVAVLERVRRRQPTAADAATGRLAEAA